MKTEKSKAVAKIGQLSENDLKALELANIIPKGTPSAQVQIFATVCKEKGLSPFQRQIYLLPFNKKEGDKWVTHYANITGIDGYRTIAERTGKYAGSDDPIFNDIKTEFLCRAEKLQHPETATVTVHKLVAGQRVPFTATAGWLSYLPGEKKRFNWDRMPFLMLGKVAEALALRKAFPEALSGVHVEEERGGFEEIKDVEAVETNEASLKILQKYKGELDKITISDKMKKEAKDIISKAVKEGLSPQHSKELSDYGNKKYLELKETEATVTKQINANE